MSSKNKRRSGRTANLQKLREFQNEIDARLDEEGHPTPSLTPSIASSTSSFSSVKSFFTRAGQYIGLLPKSLENTPPSPSVTEDSTQHDVIHNMLEQHEGQPIQKRELSKAGRRSLSIFRFGRRSRKHKKVQMSEKDQHTLYDGQHPQHADDPSLKHLMDEYGGNSRETERILHELNEFYAKSGVQDHEELLNMLIRNVQNAKSSGGTASSSSTITSATRQHEGVDEEREKRIVKEMYGRFLAGAEADNALVTILDVLMKEAAKLRKQKETSKPMAKL